MTNSQAKAVVGRSWTGKLVAPETLSEALNQLGMTEAEYRRWVAVANKAERKMPRFFILTPSGSGKHR